MYSLNKKKACLFALKCVEVNDNNIQKSREWKQIAVRRVGGAQCKTLARGPSDQCFMTSSCSVNRATTFLRKSPTCRATIDLEPKIRTAEKSFILLPKRITNVFVCTTYVSSYICLFISRNHLLQQYLILEFLLAIVTENVFFACLFLESSKC